MSEDTIVIPSINEFMRQNEKCFQVLYRTKTGVITSTLFYSNLNYHRDDIKISALQAAEQYLNKIKRNEYK